MNPARVLAIGRLMGGSACATSPLGRSRMMLVGDAEMDKIVVQGGTQMAAAMVGAAGNPASPLNGIALAALGLGAQGVVLKYSRTQESEADLLGLDYMAKAGFDPRQSVPLWQNMETASQGARPPEFLSTHPSPATRIKELQARIPQAVPLADQARAQGRKPRCR